LFGFLSYVACSGFPVSQTDRARQAVAEYCHTAAISLPFIDPLSGGYQLNQRKRLTKNKPCGNQVLEGRTFMPEDFENKKRGSLRLPWWVPLLLLLAVAIFIGILLANIFPEIWRRIPLTSPP
jgi:hypothetical protein